MFQSVDVSWPQNNYTPDAAESGVIVAATSGDGGSLFTQSTFVGDVINCRNSGKPLGHYHFNGPQGAAASADYFWSVIKPYYRPGDVLGLDIESGSGFGAQSPAWAAGFMNQLAAHIGVTSHQLRLLIYGNLSTMSGAGWGALEAAGCLLWLAEPNGWPENTPVGEWSHWTVLQYSTAGGVDRDESQLTFAQIAGAPTSAPKPQGDDMKIIIGGSEALIGEYESVLYSNPGDFSLAANGAAYGTVTGLTNDQVVTLVAESKARRAKLVKDVAAAVIASLPAAPVVATAPTFTDAQIATIAAAVAAGLPQSVTAADIAAALKPALDAVPAAVISAEAAALGKA